MAIAVVALGSNLGDRRALLASATERLGRIGRVVARSGVYETLPVGPPQPDYLNQVVLVETALEPREVLGLLLAIERELGRVREARWGPRLIDLDLVALGERVVDEPGLRLPHPEAHRRAFVLAPLVEVAPDLVLRGYGSAREFWEGLEEGARAGVRRL